MCVCYSEVSPCGMHKIFKEMKYTYEISYIFFILLYEYVPTIDAFCYCMTLNWIEAEFEPLAKDLIEFIVKLTNCLVQAVYKLF